MSGRGRRLDCDYDYDYIMAPQRGRPYGANLGSMGRNTGTWSIRSEQEWLVRPFTMVAAQADCSHCPDVHALVRGSNWD